VAKPRQRGDVAPAVSEMLVVARRGLEKAAAVLLNAAMDDVRPASAETLRADDAPIDLEADPRLAAGFAALRSELQAEIEKERQAREEALVAQEHRLVPAAVALLRSLFRREWQQVPGAAGALFWCLLPSGTSATVGLIALATLVFTGLQVALLARQNTKIDAQNVLAEGQRRAALMIEAREVIRLMEAEKERHPKSEPFRAGPTRMPLGQDCARSPCWRFVELNEDLQGGESVTAQRLPPRESFAMPLAARDFGRSLEQDYDPLFVPSRGLASRLATLTRELGAYRQAVVDRRPSCYTAPLDVVGVLSSPARPSRGTAPLEAELAQVFDIVAQRAITEQSILGSGGGVFGWLSGLGRFAQRMADALLIGEASPRLYFDCAFRSPERGRILMALLDADIHPGAIVAAGGTFAGADLRRMRIADRFLEGLDLTEADLRDAEFDGTIFYRSRLDGALLESSTVAMAGFVRTSLSRAMLPATLIGVGGVSEHLGAEYGGQGRPVFVDVALYRDMEQNTGDVVDDLCNAMQDANGDASDMLALREIAASGPLAVVLSVSTGAELRREIVFEGAREAPPAELVTLIGQREIGGHTAFMHLVDLRKCD
jgi:hypothetical protein